MLGFYAPYALGSAGATDIAAIATNVTSTLDTIAKLLSAGAYIAGFGFVVASLFKFKAHKDAPQQQPLGPCIAMLLVGSCLIFLPGVLQVGGKAIFGTGATQGTTTGFSKTDGT